MNAVFVWTGVTSYMADCWRALQAIPGVRLRIVIIEKRAAATSFRTETVLRGLDCRVVYDGETHPKEIADWVVAFAPSVLFIVGWRDHVCRFFARYAPFDGIRKVLVFDLPFCWSLKKIIAPIVLRFYLRRFDCCFVPGERAVEYARWLGFRRDRIVKGVFSVSEVESAFSGENRNGFLFIGRYIPEKRLDILIEAYRIYRNGVSCAWPLLCCGTGPLRSQLLGREGVTDLGFQQPDEVAVLRRRAGALVLCSDFDPWPLVIAEACVSGLPVICTESCGNHLELVKENGVVCPDRDVHAIAEAMRRMHGLSLERRNRMGEQGLDLVRPYTCRMWSERIVRNFSESRICSKD